MYLWFSIRNKWFTIRVRDSKDSGVCFPQTPPFCSPPRQPDVLNLSGYYCCESVKQSLRVIQSTSCRCTIASIPLNNKLNLPWALAVVCSEAYYHLTRVTSHSAHYTQEFGAGDADTGIVAWNPSWNEGFPYFSRENTKSVRLSSKGWACREVVKEMRSKGNFNSSCWNCSAGGCDWQLCSICASWHPVMKKATFCVRSDRNVFSPCPLFCGENYCWHQGLWHS